jgi:hypothetical protein
MSKIHFIGGEKGGVGKSVVARLCTQYCLDRSLPFTAVDADGSHGALLRFYAAYTRSVDITRYESVDEILALASEDQGRRILVDLPAQSDRPLGAWLAEGGVIELAAESGVGLVFWHVIDDGKDAITTLDRLFARHGERVGYCIVKNQGRGKDFSLFENSSARATAQRLGAAVIELPELYAPAMQKIDRLDASFWSAINGTQNGLDAFTRMDRQRVKVWITSAYEQLAKLGDRF